MWHEIAKEGYPPNFDENYLITDGEDYFIGNWREDAKAWDNYNMGWVKKSITKEYDYPNITHWMELPPLPKNNNEIDYKKLYEEFRQYVKDTTGHELIGVEDKK